MTAAQLTRFLQTLTPDELAHAEAAMGLADSPDRYFPTARDKQRPPATAAWLIWLIMAGRGFGKTVTGAEWIVEQGINDPGPWGIVAPTFAAGRDICVEGRGDDGHPSGVLSVLERRGWSMVGALLNVDPTAKVFTWNRSMGELRLANGALLKVLSAEEPERIRGWNMKGAWADELGSWSRPDSFDQLRFALRIGLHPRLVITATPRPTPIIRGLVARARDGDPAVVVVRGATSENAENLSEAALAELHDRYAGTRLGRQELEGELLDDVEGALWKQANILRAANAPRLARIMVGIDPSTWGEDTGAHHTSIGQGIETGMVVVGISERPGPRGHECFVLDDLSGRHSPDEWARIAVNAWRHWSHTAPTWIVPETNAGGGMVTATIRLVDPNARIYTEKGKAGVRAAVGKRARAEPVAALYEQQRVHHLGSFPVLEDQMTTWDSSLPYSPDRIDALVWAVTALKPWTGAVAIAAGSERRVEKPKPSARATVGQGQRSVGRPRARGNSAIFPR